MGTNADNRVQSDVRISDHRNDFHKMETKTQPMKLWGYLLLLVLGLLLGYFIFSHSPSITTVTVTTTDTVYTDTGTHTVSIVPKPIYINRIKIDTVIDTVYVILDYHTIKYYDDVLVDDTDLYFHYNAEVFKNKLTSFTFDYNNRRATAITTTVITNTVNKKHLYLGGTAGAGTSQVIYGVIVGYQHKQFLYMLEYDRLNNMHTDKQNNIIKGSILFNL